MKWQINPTVQKHSWIYCTPILMKKRKHAWMHNVYIHASVQHAYTQTDRHKPIHTRVCSHSLTDYVDLTIRFNSDRIRHVAKALHVFKCDYSNDVCTYVIVRFLKTSNLKEPYFFEYYTAITPQYPSCLQYGRATIIQYHISIRRQRPVLKTFNCFQIFSQWNNIVEKQFLSSYSTHVICNIGS